MAQVSLEELTKAVKALREASEFCESNTANEVLFKLARDASIQRFEFCVELSWKLAKKKMGSPSTTAKPVIREMLQNQLIDDFQLWFDFIEGRNKSSYTYDEKVAQEVFKIVKDFLPEADKLLIELANL